MTKLTDKIVAALPVPGKGNARAYDRELPGFCCVITAAGVRSFALRYRLNGKQRLATIGRHPTWTTSVARAKAKEWRRLVDQGVDPLVEPEQAPVDTVASVIAEFIKRDQKPRNRTWPEVERILVKELAPWLERDIKSITRRDVLDRLDAITDRGAPIRANRVLSWTKRLLRWAAQRGILETSPAADIEAPAREVARDRVLEPGELAVVWRAAEALQPPFRQIVQLLAVTGCRRGEVVNMRWQDLDLERRLWTIPANLNKAGRVHEVPLSDLAIEIINTQPRGEGLVFPAKRRDSSVPVVTFNKVKAKLDQSGATDWRLHDLRRTAASGMARLGYAPHVVASVLNHAPASVQGITSIYNRYRYTDEKRAALDAWSREIERLLGRGEAKVVKLPKRA